VLTILAAVVHLVAKAADMKVLSFAIYPLIRPVHGGQLRSAALNRSLVRAGWTVKHCCIFVAGLFDEVAEDDWGFPVHLAPDTRADVDCCDALLADEHKLDALLVSMRDFAPDVLMLHQPWTWPAVKAVVPKLATKPKVIYSSQNCEAILMQDLLKGYSIEQRERLLQKTTKIENALVEACDALICVSAADRDAFSPSKPNIVLRNGVEPSNRRFRTGDLIDAQLDDNKFALFIGSGHPPNGEGFNELVAPDFGFLQSNHSIVVAGNVCHLLRKQSWFQAADPADLSRLTLLDFVPDDVLAELIMHCTAIILPLVSGGGTNLKTAEALYSRKSVIATRFAFRGFETYMNMPHVHFADTRHEFKTALRRALDQDTRYCFSSYDNKRLDQLTWPLVLSPLADFLSKLVKPRPTLFQGITGLG